MKKYFYLLAPALLIFCAGQAQVKKGEVLFGGTVSYGKSNSAFNTQVDSAVFKANVTTIGPSFGWAIRDNLEFGVRLLYSYSNNDQYTHYYGSQPSFSNYNRYRGYSINFNLRRYKELGHGFALYGEGGVTGGVSTTQVDYNGVDKYMDQKEWFVVAYLSGGMTYRVSHKWMFEAGFGGLLSTGYERVKDNGQDVGLSGASSKTENFSMGTSFSKPLNNFSFGCRYILN